MSSQVDHIRLSCVVVVYNMRREAERTLKSLSCAYQRDVSEDSYEVIVIENGSSAPLDEKFVQSFVKNFRLQSMIAPSRSPAPALNFGAQTARSEIIASMIDGARISSPGCLAGTLQVFDAYKNVAAIVPSWHFGPDVQNESIYFGYNQIVEDQLLRTVDWENDGYELFKLCERLDPSSERAAWFGEVSESNFIAVHRDVYHAIGGYDERFTSAGGGAVNLDFFKRVCEIVKCQIVSLLGEGTFHQFHGGISTNVKSAAHPWRKINEEYKQIRGEYFSPPSYKPLFMGSLSPQARALLTRSPNIFTHVAKSKVKGPYDAYLFKLCSAILQSRIFSASKDSR